METFSLPKAECAECQSPLSRVELDVSTFGGASLCDSCRDRYYYESERGQLELLAADSERRIQELEAERTSLAQQVIDAEARASKRAANDRARIEALEAEVEELRFELKSRIQPGLRLRPSDLA